MSLARMTELLRPAITIALLAAIESLLSAVVADGMIGGKHRSNVELVAQGVANLASPLFGGIPATGAIARTATNIKNGGRTPVAGIVHALTLLLITLFVGRLAALIPLATLAGILIIVAYGMSGWRTFAAELRAPRSDVAVLLATFLLTVIVDLTIAIEVGMVLSAFLFMRRMAEVTNVRFVTDELRDRRDDFDDDIPF
jgi:SulP family sulfate permease